MAQHLSDQGWTRFKTQYFNPMYQLKYGSSQVKVRFLPGAIIYINEQYEDLPLHRFDQYCVKLIELCEQLYTGNHEGPITHPFVVIAGLEKCISIMTCVKILHDMLGTPAGSHPCPDIPM
jgi:hypothetical protein